MDPTWALGWLGEVTLEVRLGHRPTASLEAAVRVAMRSGVTSEDVARLLDAHDLERDVNGRIRHRVNTRQPVPPLDTDQATNEPA